MRLKKEHLLVRNYLKNHSLVTSNLISFNDFIDRRLQEIVEEVSEAIDEEDFKIKLGKISVGKPRVIEANGEVSDILPYEARLRDLTYSAPVSLEMTVKKGNNVDSKVVEIGEIPVLVRSKVCNTYGLSKEKLIENYEDPLDPGGYFIINGKERIMIMTEDLAENQPFIERDKKGEFQLRVFSSRGSYRIPNTITETNEGIFKISFSRVRDVPLILVLKALGLVKESEIAKVVGEETEDFVVNLYEYSSIGSKKDALMELGKVLRIQGEEDYILFSVKKRLDSYLLPHIGKGEAYDMDKAKTLCKLLKQLLRVKKNPALETEKDHYSSKRVRLSGDLLASLLSVNLTILIRDIKYSLKKSFKRRKNYSIRIIAKSTLFSQRVKSAIATGSWVGGRKGVTQNMDKTNYLAILSQLQRVSSMLLSEQENVKARALHPTHYGRFCATETPEGKEIGLRKNLAILSRVSTISTLNEEGFLKSLKEIGLDVDGEKGIDVFYNGRFIGMTTNPKDFSDSIREKRRKGELPLQLNIRFVEEIGNIIISTEVGRVLRPLIVVEKGISKFNDEVQLRLKEGEIDFDWMLKNGVVEYLDASEEENALVALSESDLTKEHTHLEIDPIDLFGIVTSLVPYANHNQSSRLNRGSKAQKQALGIYNVSYPSRLDTDVSILHYPQKPIVRSFVYDSLDVYPAGQNLVVGIMTYKGYNMQDSLVLNKGSLDRGVGRSSYFRPYKALEVNYIGGLRDEIKIPDKDVSGYKIENDYRLLEADGIIGPEAEVHEGDVLIGKVSPPKFFSEEREISVQSKKESSVSLRQEEEGIIDNVFITEDLERNKLIQVRTRDSRIPELGDKFETSQGQKGTVGYVIPEVDVPFTSRGIKPDILFNPHGLPSRMTVGYLLDSLAGKVGSLKGEVIDGSAFSGTSQKELEEDLLKLGFEASGKETMFDGITGKQMEVKIFVGSLYYQKLKYMVKNKIHGRASGKIELLTRQPIGGRAHGGAMKLGEMEQQAIISHGASLLLKERYSSDNVRLPICRKCGEVAIEDRIKKKIICSSCTSSEFDWVEISYAFKLLMEYLRALGINTSFELKSKYE